jgi:hypothetical protein
VHEKTPLRVWKTAGQRDRARNRTPKTRGSRAQLSPLDRATTNQVSGDQNEYIDRRIAFIENRSVKIDSSTRD